MRYFAYKGIWTALDWLFPPICSGCNKPGSRWCSECSVKTRRIMPPYCDICGIHHPAGGVCFRCKDNPPRVTALRSWVLFDDPIRNAIHQLKYQRNIALGDAFTQELVDIINKTGWKIDIITPVPLGVARQKERGYNQASLLAKPVALKLKIPFQQKAVSRTRETRSQVELNREQRKRNVAGAFTSDPGIVKDRNILIIDDVTTSGATLDSCAEALFQAGAVDVYGLTLARAV